MEKVLCVLVLTLSLALAAYGENGGPDFYGSQQTAVGDVINQITTNQSQDVSVNGGDSSSDSQSNASVNMNSTSVSNYETRTPPLTSLPPYLPYWTHGGWGTVKAYFPNGPTANDQIYETTFDPKNPEEMREIRSVLKALPHAGLLQMVGGALNNVAVALFGKPDTYFHGRGLEIADSIVRDRRPEAKPLLVFIDSNVDMNLLTEEGYAYVGKVSVEGDPERTWDHAYKAAVAEALLWDVDILLVSGGMKGVTTGTNITFPSAAAGYSQISYSLSLFGAKAKGITEGKGKAVLSAEAYRYLPSRIDRRRIPASIYDRIRLRPRPVAMSQVQPTLVDQAPIAAAEETRPAPVDEVAAAPACQEARPAPANEVVATPARQEACQPPAQQVRQTSRPAPKSPGITMSRELFELAGFPNDQQVGYVSIR